MIPSRPNATAFHQDLPRLGLGCTGTGCVQCSPRAVQYVCVEIINTAVSLYAYAHASSTQTTGQIRQRNSRLCGMGSTISMALCRRVGGNQRLSREFLEFFIQVGKTYSLDYNNN